MPDNTTTTTLSGKQLSPGLGEGEIFVYRDIMNRLDEFYEIDQEDCEPELKRLDLALSRISKDLSALADRVEAEIDSELSGVFHAHLAMVQDASLKAEVETEIKDELVSSGSAVRTVFRRWERRFQSMDAEVSQQKGDDMQDLARRLVSALAGVHAHDLEGMPRGSVLVANRLLPSDTVFLARGMAAAALLEVGAKGSHAALFAREIGLACVAGLPGLLELVSESSYAVVDADDASAIVNPTDSQRNVFLKKAELRKETIEKARARAHKPALTKDGAKIAVLANVGDEDDTRVAIENGADGVGLYRLEQIYLSRQHPPSTAELLEVMQSTLEPAKGLPVYVRLLDVGADKPLPFIDMPKEQNPSLGQRGIRFLKKYPELLQTQLDALLQLSSDFDLHILVPMVTLPGDMAVVEEALKEAISKAGPSRIPKLGAMIETPAAALAAADISKHASFLSFGTNDLTQYSFAADRENASVDAYFDDAHDAIFRLIGLVHDDVPDMALSVCGELAGRSKATGRLLERGVTSLSVVPLAIPTVKEAVRDCRRTHKRLGATVKGSEDKECATHGVKTP
ncbi:phosphoenolpyruvate--protein phosphotransferase [Akkermansiaceae bacterium]|nr:phosphoenolpyruvate--protein phosphotransferase [Akkermansiaceae bacterium]MDA7891278.1 phosphoenolpyruvate--protein phosphotransferase [Akkermansiaceae bacterium]MDA7929385.1 phosphoenolpyruvate--protein phosphotransferase [Akkermansiaceae bacterium]MDB4466129.1 phosphoenolpyruvate--protein phosphotransferase [bacterium]MDB4509832.1 phosphoenolpyruvate--protein phosphotransferase [Akkermansiaceae bacterium]